MDFDFDHLIPELKCTKVRAFMEGHFGVTHKSSSAFWNTLTLILRFNYDHFNSYEVFIRSLSAAYGSVFLCDQYADTMADIVFKKIYRARPIAPYADVLLEAWLNFFVKQCNKKNGLSRLNFDGFDATDPRVTDFIVKLQNKLEVPTDITQLDNYELLSDVAAILKLKSGQTVNAGHPLYSLYFGLFARLMSYFLKNFVDERFLFLSVDGWNQNVSNLHFSEFMSGHNILCNDVSGMDTSLTPTAYRFFCRLMKKFAVSCNYDIDFDLIYKFMLNDAKQWRTGNAMLNLKAEAHFMLGSGRAWTLFLNTVNSCLYTFMMIDQSKILAAQFKGDDSMVALSDFKCQYDLTMLNLHRVKVKPIFFKVNPEFCHQIYTKNGSFPICTRLMAKFLSYFQPDTIHSFIVFSEFLLGWKEQLRLSLSQEFFGDFIAANVCYHAYALKREESELVEWITSVCLNLLTLYNTEARKLFKCMICTTLVYQH
jgi:hypothetical protein